MEKLKQDIYNYFLPMASDEHTAAIVTYNVMVLISNHMSEYVDLLEYAMNALAELQETNVALQNRLQQSEEAFMNGMRLAYDTITAIADQQKSEERLEELEAFQKEL